MHVNFAVRFAQAAQCFLRSAGHGGRHVEHFHDGRSLRATEPGVASKDMIGGDPPLPIRRTRQRNLRRLAGNKIFDFHRVADGVDVRIASLHVLAYTDAAARPHVQFGIDR